MSEINSTDITVRQSLGSTASEVAGSVRAAVFALESQAQVQGLDPDWTTFSIETDSEEIHTMSFADDPTLIEKYTQLRLSVWGVQS